ncbi:hypothetical protein DFH06DRAFT_1402502 [Mycena polygramma]|nr:hypothetical protein DFH06DRAFT_1402502 [Mycena polygramma]
MANPMLPQGIAIVGIAAQLPSGSTALEDLDYASFWPFLLQGDRSYEPLENVLPGLADHTPGMPRQGSFLKTIASFDNVAFGISARDARVIPYSARRLLDLSFKALLDSGIDYRGKRIGCFMSGNQTRPSECTIDADGSCSWMLNAMPNRVSYTFNLTGPSCFVDTACSSSLTALHLATNAIEHGDCSAAIVGSAQVNRDPFEWVSYVQAGLLPPDGMCKPFDKRADGFGRGEGAVVFVLKPLKDAIQDNDHVYSVIVGSAINATGSRMPLNVPSGIAQQGCIYEAYRRACLDPKDADYIELHATGTAVGDPIEVNAAGAIFGRDTGALVGSVKGNIGHLEGTAFLASLVKACLVLEQKTIPPTVNLSNATRTIDWDGLHVVVPVQPTALGCRSSSGRSTISLSAAGIGGATGHVIIQAPPAPNRAVAKSSSTPVLFLVGGLSSNVVEQIARAVSLLDGSDLGQHAVTLSRRARQLPWRTYFTVPLSPLAAVPYPTRVLNEAPPVVFIFSGQGPQNLGMGRQLFAEYPVFRNTVLELDEVYRRVKGVSLLESTGLFITPGSRSISPTVMLPDFAWPAVITLAATAMVQIAMFDLLKSIGIIPEVMLGHSAGETPVLYASGAGPKEMAMEIAIARGDCMASVESPEVGMAMVSCSADRALTLIAHVTSSAHGVLEISCFNAPESITFSGSSALLDQLVDLARREGLYAQRLRTLVPSHSSLLDDIKCDHYARMDDIFARYPGPHSPCIPVFSTCQAQELVETFSADYFWDNCRKAVQFSDAIAQAIKSSPICVEISCHPVLSSSILAHGVADTLVLCPMRRLSTKPSGPASTEQATFLDTIGRLSLLGINSIDLSGLYGFSALKSNLIDHPLTPRAIPPPKTFSSHLSATLQLRNRPLSSSTLKINTTTHPDLAEHVVNGEPILPATGFIELLLEAGANFLWDVNFLSILSLASSSPLEVDFQRLDVNWSITTTTASGEREHAHGCMDKSDPPNPGLSVDVFELWEKLPRLNFSGKRHAVSAGRFRRVLRCHGTPVEAIAEIKGPTAEELTQNYLLHPIILDVCLHLVLHPSISKEYGNDVVYLPSHLEHFVFYRRETGGGNWFSSVRLRKWTPECRYYDICVYDANGLPLCNMRNLAMKKFSATAPRTIQRRFDLIFQPVVIPIDIPHLAETFPARPNESQIILLHDVLDFLAVEMVSKTLEGNVVCGEDESRRRYMSFARHALTRRTKEPFAPEIVQALKSTWPHHFEVTRRVAAVHESVFQGPKLVVDSLFSDGLMAQFYSEYSETSNICHEVTKAFSGILELLRASGKKSIRILEFGAGTGLLTRLVIEELKRNPDLLAEYTLTDISYALVANLADTISHGSVVPKAYDISADPNIQGIQPNSYDIIVALHALHVAPTVATSLSSLQNLLVPGGSLLVVELDGNSWPKKSGSVWLDCVFGCFPEWFGYADGREHCTMAPASWKTQLEALDFINVCTCTEDGDSGRDFFFVAQKSPSCSPSGAELSTASPLMYIYQFGREIELQTALTIHDPTASSITVHIVTVQGRDADSAVGLCATLRKEFQSWNIRLCIFESATSLSHPVPLLSQNAWIFESGEDVVFIGRDGNPNVLRLVISSAPSTSAQIPQVSEDTDSIDVRVCEWAGVSDGYDGFVGYALSTHPTIAAGQLIGGVAEITSARNFRVPIGNTIPVPGAPSSGLSAEILGAVLGSFLDNLSFPSVRILIAVEPPNLVAILERHVSIVPQVELVAADFTDPDAFNPVDIILSDSRTYTRYPHLRRWIVRGGKTIIWDTLLRAAIRRDPSFVSQILAKGLTPPSTPDLSRVAMRHTLSITPLRRASPPFRPDYAYILLGGIGGLGVDLAVWLYEHGARHLILTSRRGLASLDPDADAIALAKIAYLRSQSGLNLQLEQCDATDEHAMRLLLRNLAAPIAGCFHMPLVLRDALFVDQTHETFKAVQDSKLKVFEIFAAQVTIDKLDFFVGMSSVSGLVGLRGQSNYASACTALDGALAQCPNAFSLITPGITDVGFLDRDGKDKSYLGSMTAKELWGCLEDGLQKLDDGRPFNQYIPDLSWNSIDSQFGLPLAYRHLMLRHSRSSILSIGEDDSHEEILRRVLDLLDIAGSDFDALQPLTIYGLDSISAARLSSLLKPYASFSQMQLLGGVTWADVVKEMQSAAGMDAASSVTNILLDLLDVPRSDFSPDISLSSYGLESLGAARLATALQPFMTVTQMQLMGETTWAELLQLMDVPASSLPTPLIEPLVEIRSGPGTPLIILPGGSGSILPFFGLREAFQGPIWTLQITESTPLESLPGLAAFWKDKIREKRPHGPYHFAAYCASALAGIILTKLMEDAGEVVLRLTFIENSPLLWAREESEVLLREKTVGEYQDLADRAVLNMLRNDPAIGPEAVSKYEAAVEGLAEASVRSRVEVLTSRTIMALIFRFLQDFYPSTEAKSYGAFCKPFKTWVSSVKAPMVIFVAEQGIVNSSPGGAWPDLGASRFGKAVSVRYFAGVGHYGLLKDERVARELEL